MSTAWIEEYFAAWGKGDADAVASYMADDVEYEDCTLGHVFKGTDAVKAFVAESASKVPGMAFDIVTCASDDDAYYAEWVMQPMGLRGTSVGTRRDGKIAVNRDFWDGREMPIA